MDREIVAVLGTGRSGTSLVTKTLVSNGLAVSDNLIGASPSNQCGAYEDVRIFELQRELMQALHLLERLRRPDQWQFHPDTQRIKEEMASHIASEVEMAAGRSWVVKDPKSVLFIPLWQEIAETLGYRLKFIVCLRTPQGTIGSIVHHYKTAVDRANATYAMRMYYLLNDFPVDALCIDYEHWHHGPGELMVKLANFLGYKSMEHQFEVEMDNSGLFDSSLVFPISADLYRCYQLTAEKPEIGIAESMLGSLSGRLPDYFKDFRSDI